MTSEIDFPYGGNLKSILEAGIRAVTQRREPHYGEYFFSYVWGPFRPSSIAFEMSEILLIQSASSPPRRDLSGNGVPLNQFYLYSHAPDTKMAWLMLKQNSLKLLLLLLLLLLLVLLLLGAGRRGVHAVVDTRAPYQHSPAYYHYCY